MVLKYSMPILLAIVVGACTTLQPVCNTAVSRTTGTWYATFYSLMVSIVIVAVICFANDSFHTLTTISETPKWFFVGGACGILIVALTVICMSRMGPVMTSSITVAAQMIAATICAHFGMMGFNHEPINLMKIVGILMLIGGAVLVSMSIDK